MATIEQQVWDQFVKGPTVQHEDDCKCPFCTKRKANLERLNELKIRDYPDTFVRILEVLTEQDKFIKTLRQAVSEMPPRPLPLNRFGRIMKWLCTKA